MQRRKNYAEKLFTSFQLSDRMPKENLCRMLRESLDLNSIYNDTKELYGSTGNPSIDPVVFFEEYGAVDHLDSGSKVMSFRIKLASIND